MAYYNGIAHSYNELYGEEQLNKLHIIKENIKTGKTTRMLDVGCGTGISSDFDCFVVGIDPSIELLNLNNRPKLMGLAECMPFKKNSFDIVISVTSVHNFKNIKKAIDEMKRVGKQNFVFSVLKKSRKFAIINKIIKKSFIIEKAVEDVKDIIFFCKNVTFIYGK